MLMYLWVRRSFIRLIRSAYTSLLVCHLLFNGHRPSAYQKTGWFWTDIYFGVDFPFWNGSLEHLGSWKSGWQMWDFLLVSCPFWQEPHPIALDQPARGFLRRLLYDQYAPECLLCMAVCMSLQCMHWGHVGHRCFTAYSMENSPMLSYNRSVCCY